MLTFQKVQKESEQYNLMFRSAKPSATCSALSDISELQILGWGIYRRKIRFISP